MRDDEDRPRDASSAADAGWADVVVPDDIRELAPDIEAYHKERRRVARRDRLQRLMARRAALPLVIVACAVVIATVIAMLLTMLAPSTLSRPPAGAPIATNPGAAVGQRGGLLPDATLHSQDGEVSARATRPVLLALIPLHCGCTNLLSRFAGQAFSENMRLDVVAPAATDAEAVSMVNSINGGEASLLYDPAGALAQALHATGVTLVMVNRDATIYQIFRSATVTSTASVPALLQSMLLTSASD